jgi:hypothetical protein
MNDRSEHLDWCKKRALGYVDRGQFADALASMGSDLDKHPDTANHKGIQIGLLLLLNGSLNNEHDMRRFIEGFN